MGFVWKELHDGETISFGTTTDSRLDTSSSIIDSSGSVLMFAFTGTTDMNALLTDKSRVTPVSNRLPVPGSNFFHMTYLTMGTSLDMSRRYYQQSKWTRPGKDISGHKTTMAEVSQKTYNLTREQKANLKKVVTLGYFLPGMFLRNFVTG